MITGLRAATRKNLQLDAGALYKNYNPASDTPESAAAKLIGATVGGSTFAATPEVRQVAVDGAKGPTKGYEAIDSWTCTLTTNLKEVSVESIKLALGAVTTAATTTAPTGYTKIEVKDLADADYVDNITWIGRMSGSQKPIMIIMKNALCLNGFSLQAQDKNEGQIPLVVTAHYDVAALDEVPVTIYVPDVESGVTT